MRQEFSARVKVAAYERSKGRCEQCGGPLHVGRFHFDHIVPDALGGLPVVENCAVICRPCHDTKTRGQDVPQIAKMKRQHARHIGAKQSRNPIPGSRASGIRKRMNGKVERW